MADVKFDIEVTGIKELRFAAQNFERLGKVSSLLAAQYKPLGAQTNRLVKEQNRLANVKKTLAKAVKAERIDIAQANKAMEEEVRVSRERILTDKRLIASAKRKAKAEADSRRETERLTRAYAPARVAADAYQAKLKEIDQAAFRGIISQKEAAEAARTVARDFNAFTEGVATGGNQFAKFNVESYKSAQTLKRTFNTSMQQAGFQIGDFAVQMQSGTNIAVAFGQQMSQLLGVFGATGAIAGAGVAIATAFIAPLIQSRDEAKNLQKEFQNIVTALDNNADKSARLIELGYAGPLEKARKTALTVLETFKKIDQERARQAFAGSALELTGTLETALTGARLKSGGGLRVPFTNRIIGEGSSAASLLGSSRGNKQEQQIAKELIRDINELQLLILEASRGPAEGLAQRAVELFNSVSTNSAATKDFVEQFKEVLTTSGLFAQAQSEITAEQEKQREIAEATNEATAESVRLSKEAHRLAVEENNRRIEYQERIARFNREGDIALAIKTYEERKRQEEEAHKLFIKNAELRYKAEKRVYDNALTTAAQIYKDRKKAEEDFAKDYLDSHDRRYRIEKKRRDLELADAVGIYKRRMKAEEKALKESYEERARIAKSQEMRNAASFMAGPLAIDMGMLADAARLRQKILDDEQKTFQGVEDHITTLEQRLSKERQLQGVAKDDLSLTEALIDARHKYGEVATEAQMKVIEETLRLIDVELRHKKVVEEVKARQEELSESLGSALEDAMMSIVDGTATVKDAFKEMAAAIIKDLYRVLVVQQLVASFETATAPFTSFLAGINANGNAFSRGNRITAYANGGVVGGPTYFPMSGNRVGLMGEAGPEAIMPLSRGKDGKLGVQASGQGVTVNQNINISTGVQQTVRTEIKSLMPQIAEASKAAVADAKRRGGSYGRTFS